MNPNVFIDDVIQLVRCLLLVLGAGQGKTVEVFKIRVEAKQDIADLKMAVHHGSGKYLAHCLGSNSRTVLATRKRRSDVGSSAMPNNRGCSK